MKKLSAMLIFLLFLACLVLAGGVRKNPHPFQKFRARILHFFFTKQGQLAKELYNAVDHASGGYEPEWVELVLEKGADPEYCKGECGYCDNNPLMVLMEGVNVTYYQIPEMVPDADVQVMKMLLHAGSDIHLLPYVWYRVYLCGDKNITSIQESDKRRGSSPEEILKHINNYLEDNNCLLKAFLEAGVDPDMRGDSYPFSYDAMYKMNDKLASTYFEKGTRPINEAIKKGIVWESQVDLLLQYTKLDEDSLKAAEESKDTRMIEKINALWIIQQGDNNGRN